MNQAQMEFMFEAQLCHKTLWELSDEGCAEAVEIVIDLLKKGIRPVWFHQVAAIRSGFQPNEPIPSEKVGLVSKNEDIIRDERLRIKYEIEVKSPIYQLVIVGEKGQSARTNGRAPAYGFDLRDSVAGAQDDKAQIRLGVGLIEKAFSRTPALRDDPDIKARLAIPNLLSDCNQDLDI